MAQEALRPEEIRVDKAGNNTNFSTLGWNKEERLVMLGDDVMMEARKHGEGVLTVEHSGWRYHRSVLGLF